MGFLEGALRMMPAVGVQLPRAHALDVVLFPFAVLPSASFSPARRLWPFFEQWATGDKSAHHINDRPRNAPVRTGIGVAGVCFYGILWAEGANDVLADKFNIPLYTITWIARVAIFVVPIGSYFVTKRICLGLQRKDAEMLTHGLETGIIRQLPNGEFIEESRPLTEEEHAVVASKQVHKALPVAAEVDENGIPAPAARGLMGGPGTVANRAFLETVDSAPGHGDGYGHGDGHAVGDGHPDGHAVADGEHAAVTSGDPESH